MNDYNFFRPAPARRLNRNQKNGVFNYSHIEVYEPRVMLSATPASVTSTAPDDLMLGMYSEMPQVTTQVDSAYEAWRNETFVVDSYTLDDVTFDSESDVAIQDQAMFDLIGLGDVYSNTAYRGTGYSVAVLD
ncbi:MAG: hypothetical protein R3C11_29730, partial [Planctomycetaceae bacterium]